MSSFPRTVRKPKGQPADAGPDLPGLAEAEAVLLDLASVFADSAPNLNVVHNYSNANGQELGCGRACARP